jgi:hypothetical protein
VNDDDWSGFDDFDTQKSTTTTTQSTTKSKPLKTKSTVNDDFSSLDVKSKPTTVNTSKTSKDEDEFWEMLNK